MKKLAIVVMVLVVLTGALATAGFVYAQSSNPPATPVPGWMNPGRMMNGWRGGMMQQGAQVQTGWMHETMVKALAEKLGLSVDEINNRLAKGESMSQIALSKGMTAEQLQTLMQDARSQAIDQAVKDGTLTQAQADWMKQHSAGMMGGQRGQGFGNGQRGRGMMNGNGGTMPCLDGDESGNPAN